MFTWTESELQTIGNTDEWTIQTSRRHGSLRTPYIVWGVRVGDELHIRAVRGRTSPWFRGMQSRHAGNVMAGDIVKGITFVEVFDFELAPQDMEAIATLDTKTSNFFDHRDPAIVKALGEVSRNT